MSRAVWRMRNDNPAGAIDRLPVPFLFIHQHRCQTFAEALDLFVFWCDDGPSALVDEAPKTLRTNCGESFGEGKSLIESRRDYELAFRIDIAKLAVHFRGCKTVSKLPGLVELHYEFAGAIDKAPLVADVCECETFLREVKLFARVVTRSRQCGRNDERAGPIDVAVLLFRFAGRTALLGLNHCQAIREVATVVGYWTNHQLTRAIDVAGLVLDRDACEAFRETVSRIRDGKRHLARAVDVGGLVSVRSREQRFVSLLRIGVGSDCCKKH